MPFFYPPSRSARRRRPQLGYPTRGKPIYQSRRMSIARRFAAGPPGFTRRQVARVVREMPIYAPPPTAKQEMKYIDVASATYVGDSTGAVTFLTPITGGSIINAQRDGARVMLCGTQIRGYVLSGSTTTVAQATMVLVYDRQSNKAAPTIAQVYEAATSSSFQVVDYRSRFDILGRWNYTLIGNSATPTVGREYQNIDLKTTFQKLQVWEDSGDGAIGDLISGGLFLLTFGNNAAGTTAANFTVQIRTFYGDN